MQRQKQARQPGAAEVSEAAAGASGALRYLPQVVVATVLVAVCPVAVVWWLRVSGVLSSYILGMLIGMVLAMGGAQLGRAYWQKRPGSQDLLFSELMVWGYVHRLFSQARLSSARKTLGTMSEAQRGVAGGISAEYQASTLEKLAKRLDARDPGTHGHSRRVARYAWMIATRMGLPAEQVARIRTAAAVHDLGKIQTPNSILRKAGSLTDEEYEVMKRHASDGARLAEALNDHELTEMVEHHHERLDGTGYPSGLAGGEIPLGARIISVADTFDSITAHRPYRAAKPHKVALDILLKESGKQLDPDAVKAFCSHYSGRRALAFWSTLTAVPERALGELGNGLAGVASAAKVVAVAAILGNVAAGTASIAHPSRSSSHSSGAVSELAEGQGLTRSATSASGARRTAAIDSTPGVPGSRASKTGLSTTGGAGAEGRPVGQLTPSNSSPANGSGAGGSNAGETGRAEPGSPPQHAQEGRNEGQVEAKGGSGETKAPAGTTSGGGSEAGKHKTEPVQGTVEGTTKVVEGTKKAVEGTVETVKGTVEETKGKVEETVKGTVEETKGKVEEVKGKVEETKGKVEKVIGKILPKL
jgi:putative nucleotidyltransferase with HDIG domain